MASSSVSQDDVDIDFEISSRRSRIRTARARNINPQCLRLGENDDGHGSSDGNVQPGHLDHDASPKPISRLKEKRVNRPNHANKGKPIKDRRKLREKRRSTGVIQLYSTESTGGSTGEDEDLPASNVETIRNIHLCNDYIDKKQSYIYPEHRHKKSSVYSTQHKRFSPSDLEADDEDNQDYDSLTMSDSAMSMTAAKSIAPSIAPLTATRPTNGRPATPTAESFDDQLERAREENRRLLSMMEEKDRRITTLETHLGQISFELTQANHEKTNLLQEKTDLTNAISTLSAK